MFDLKYANCSQRNDLTQDIYFIKFEHPVAYHWQNKPITTYVCTHVFIKIVIENKYNIRLFHANLNIGPSYSTKHINYVASKNGLSLHPKWC